MADQRTYEMSEPRRKSAWGAAAPVAPQHPLIGAFGVPMLCSFCSVNLVNVPENQRKSAQEIITENAQNRNACYLRTRIYCSEVCVIREAMELLGAIYKDAFIERMLTARPNWATEATVFDKMQVTRDCRKGQVMAAPRPTRPLLGVKYARQEQPIAVSAPDHMTD